MRPVVMAVLTLAIAGCASSPRDVADREARSAREFAEATKGRVAGEPQSCIDPMRISGPQVIAPDTLVYRDGARVYTTRVPGCAFLDWNSLIVTEVQSGSQVCRNDRFQALQRGTPGIPGPWCRFESFTPWENRSVKGRTG